MAIHLSSSVCELPGIGGKAASDLKTLGVSSVGDLLWYLPFRYDDYSKIVGAGKVRSGELVTVVGTIQSLASRPAKNRRVKLVEGVIADETGELKVVWFNQEYLERTMPVGSKVSLAGRIDGRFGTCLVNPIIEKTDMHVHTGRIVPVYGLTGSLTMRRLREAIKIALPAAQEMEDWLPQTVIEHESYSSLCEALRGVHFPDSQLELQSAVARLKFDELFLHQLMFAHVRAQRARHAVHSIPINGTLLKDFVRALPFELTTAQRKAIWEIVQDLAGVQSMNRLLEGDVGSGKTVVAAAACASVLEAGQSVVYLAPTEILAAQQHEAFCRLLRTPVALLTRTQQKIGNQEVTRSQLLDALKAITPLDPHLKRGERIRCVIGTHAVLEDYVELEPALVIVDEQHRFGVEQRHALLAREGKTAPHLLSMTATPIPRSLALTIYGDLELSILNEMPAGRKPVATALVPETQHKGMWNHVRELIGHGNQVFVVCPLIDPSDKLGARSVTEVAGDLKKGPLSDTRIGTLHGRMKPDEKEEAIRQFRDGKIDVLVSTTVVEVGVDIPNASVMVIVGAERFGLSQLHQLRGRVGRSDIQSYCYLLPEQLSDSSEKRLRAVETIHDGFLLAEKDLELRGPGNVFGNAQSGFPDFQLATPADTEIMKKARDYATELLQQDPELERYPFIRARIKQSFERVHLE
ncbi:ATP-dependent DNA helicase RecG [Candidatus Uhrbacteria bacterium]|nr:ATP-dependent DNA helicase RecG [Candidatus Uhrbacteria bacterium]